MRPAFTRLSWVRFLLAFVVGLVLTALLLLIFGINPAGVLAAMVKGSVGSRFGLAATATRTIPILLCALATALPAWVGLINIGCEGQFYLGAIGGTAVVLFLPGIPSSTVLPAMVVAAFLFGALWAGLAGTLRALWRVNETLSTLLLNFVAIFLLGYLLHGPWKDPKSFSWPYSKEFPRAAVMPTIGEARLHPGLAFALLALLLMAAWRNHTTWGFKARILEGNPNTAALATISASRYILWTMLVAGGLAALAGVCEVSAIQGRLREEISSDFGYNGFLAAWLARHRPLYLLPASVLVACLVVGGDLIQTTLRLPFATVNVVLACVLLSGLGVESALEGSWR